jgi:hypothetical protein
MRSTFLAYFLLAAALLVPSPGRAFLFGSKDKETEKGAAPGGVTTRYHLKIPDKATERELLNLFQWKNTVAAQIQVLRQLGEEKLKEEAQVERQLLGQFSIKPNINYTYDAATKTIYELVPTEVGASVTKKDAAAKSQGAYEKRKHLELQRDEQVKLYAQLAAGKQLVTEELRVFQFVLQEKQAELERVNAQLNDKFSISRDRQYDYDSKTMRLYEIIPPPHKETAPPPTASPQTPIQFR